MADSKGAQTRRRPDGFPRGEPVQALPDLRGETSCVLVDGMIDDTKVVDE